MTHFKSEIIDGKIMVKCNSTKKVGRIIKWANLWMWTNVKALVIYTIDEKKGYWSVILTTKDEVSDIDDFKIINYKESIKERK